ncbi:MAG: hypothetical protein AAF620_01115 [Bacteroidota bacterium]
MDKINLYERFPIIESQDNLSFLSNGSFSLSYHVELSEVFFSSEKDFDKMYDLRYKFLKGLPQYTIFLQQDSFLNNTFTSKSTQQENFFSRETTKHFNGRKYLRHQCNFHFIFAKDNFLLNRSYSHPFQKLPINKTMVDDLNQVYVTWQKNVQQSIEYIASSDYFKIKPFTEKEIIDDTLSHFNGYYFDREVDLLLENNKITAGNKYIDAFSIPSKSFLPEDLSNIVINKDKSSSDYLFYEGVFDSLGFEIPQDHIINQVIFIDDHFKIKSFLEASLANLQGWSGVSADNRKAAQRLEAMLSASSDKEQSQFLRCHFNLIFFHETEQERINAENAITTRFKHLDIQPYQPKGKELQSLYLNTHFTTLPNLSDDQVFLTDLDLATCLFNNTTNYKSDQDGIEFNDRVFNIPIVKDTWGFSNEELKLKNFIITATSRSGKSYVAQNIFRQFIDRGFRLLINDMGDSYQKTALLYPKISQYIKWEDKKPLGLNPFLNEGKLISAEKLNNLVEFVRILWKRDEPLDQNSATSLRKIITSFYQYNPSAQTFFTFYKYIEFLWKEKELSTLDINNKFFNAEEFLHRCSDFMPGGTYGYLFPEKEHKDTLILDNKQVVVLEYANATSDPLILSILLGQSNEVERKFLFEDRTTPGISFYDEFAKQLHFPNVLAGTEYKFQTLAKYNSAIGLVLQNPSQLPINGTAQSILDNTAIHYILKNLNGYESIVERYNLNEHDHNQLKSLSNKFEGEQKYSEIYLRILGKGNVVRLETPEAVRLAFLTDGVEHEQLMQRYNSTHDMEEAIKQHMHENN